MFHYGRFRNDELIVLGHNVYANDCWLVRLVGLPGDEQEELRRIASSPAAQETPYLASLISKPGMEKANSGETWWTYLIKQSTRRNSPVFKLPLKEIQDSLDPDQRAIFKGYGKDRMEKRLTPVQPAPEQVDKIDKLMETMAEQNRQTQTMMLELLKALAPSQQNEIQSIVKEPRKPRRSPRKKIEPLIVPPEMIDEAMVITD